MTQEEDKQLKITNQLKNIIDNLNQHWHSIQLLLGSVSKPLIIDDRGLANVLGKLQEQVKVIISSISTLDITQTFCEIKYIGKRLNQIEEDIRTIKDQNEKGIKKNIHLEFTCDGYEMVKKQSKYEIKDKEDAKLQAEANIRALLFTLSERESSVLSERFALFGGKKKTLDQVGELLKVNRERVRQIEAKALRKCRHPERKLLVDRIMHKALKEAIGL